MSRSAYLILSLCACVLIAGGTYGGYVYIGKHVAGELRAEPVFSAEEATAASAEEVDMKKIIHDAQKSVVMIETDYGLGSGFLYNDKGDIITNAHVVEGADTVRVQLSDSATHSGSVIGRSDKVDVALVRVEALKDRKPLPIREKEHVETGEEVIALGSPRGLQNTATTGIISGVDRNIDISPYTYENVYQTSAPIAPGSSGGPLIEQNSGKAVGINSAGAGEGDIGFSIPIIDVLPMLKEWSENPAAITQAPAEQKPSTAAAIDQEAAAYLVGYYFESLNVGDMATAYELLSQSWKQQESYEEFASRNADLGWINIRDIDTTIVGNNAKVMFALIEDTGSEQVWYQATYTVAAENGQHVIVDKEWEAVE
ncbi:S1C family serine protease [Bacillus piscicola]|uniref:S1C family serine protease n=1 Tax=Bacillus piscicola TaxID=1632684 RepID=UPI001F0A029E|nr:trypsin-like peptidase domain-containing protein [Bacillus piscicola]